MDNTFTIRLAGPEDAVKVHDIMAKAYESLSDKSFFICDDLPYVENIINNPQEGFALLCMADDKPAGTLLVRFPGFREDNLGRDLSLEEDKLMSVVHMESAAVLPEFRGNGIQKKLLFYVKDYLAEHFPDIRYIAATVAPLNMPSRKSFKAAGFKEMLTKEKYNGHMRIILLNNM